ncbi:MAG: response regulator [Fibromonadaceae bacterium]|jgi:CheY-like chemotaxis protein|nr:response regulator [Fibromonadaceae bacterium]
MAGVSILVVDDVEVNLEVAKLYLKPYNLYVELADSGQRAINFIEDKNEYDLIFMDHLMPVMDGIETVKIIRNMDSEYAKNVPIVALTANTEPGNEKIFLENGFSDFISKPIDINKLDICLKKWIRKDRKKTQTNVKNYINFEDGIAQFGSEAKFKKVLSSFKKHVPTLLKELEENNGNDYIISIHALKGCARTIFLNEIGERAYELEKAAKNGDWEFVKSKNSDLIKDVQKLIDDIKVV